MADDNLIFSLLNLNENEEKQLNSNAIINEVTHNPESAAKQYSFYDDRSRTYRAFPLHQAIRLKANIHIIETLYTSYPLAITAKCSIITIKGCTALYFALKYNAPNDVVLFILSKWPEAVREETSLNTIPLHDACRNGYPVEVVSLLLKSWPDSTKKKDSIGWTPLHIAVYDSAPLEVISLLLNYWPFAAREKSDGNCASTPLHFACNNDSSTSPSSLEGRGADREAVVSLLLNTWPDAAMEKDDDNFTPLHDACCCQNVSLKVILLLLDHFPEAVMEVCHDGGTPLDLYERYLEEEDEFSNTIRKVLAYVSLICSGEKEKMSNELAREIINLFIETEWWNGIRLLLKYHPLVYKCLEIDTKVLPCVLSVLGRRRMMSAMFHVMSNELDIVEGS